MQYATFTIDEHLFGVNVLTIREINRNVDITPVDLAPDFVRGLLNLRGQIVTVIDPAVRLGIGAREIKNTSRCVVLKTTLEVSEKSEDATLIAQTVNEMVGLLVDSIGDMVTADERELEPPPANIGVIDGKFLAGVLKMQDRLMISLKMGELLTSA